MAKRHDIMFGQLVIGPPGSGKSTYCKAMHEFLTALGRKTVVINLDPANEHTPYTTAVDIRHLVQTDDVMATCDLGPNGALMYAFDFLESNTDWLIQQINQLADSNSDPVPYLLFDCPGQIELYTNSRAMYNIVRRLTCAGNDDSEWCPRLRLCAVNLVDSHHAGDAFKFISACLVSLQTMLHVELPHINVLSKVDQIEEQNSPLVRPAWSGGEPISAKKTAFNVDFYTQVLDLSHLVPTIHGDKPDGKLTRLSRALCSIISSYSLVSYLPLNVQSSRMMGRICGQVDKANGYCFASSSDLPLQEQRLSAFTNSEFEYDAIGEIHEKMNDANEDDDDLVVMAKEKFQI